MLDTSRINGSTLTALQTSKLATDKLFETATNNSEFTFTAVADSGCSETCTNTLLDFIPGTMCKLEVPIALGGIAGSLLVTQAGKVHWETIDDFGKLVEIKTVAFYHSDLPGRLFSPQAYFNREHKGEDMELAVRGDESIWRVHKKDLFKLKYDASFMPRLTLFLKAAPTLMALQTVIHDSNQKLSPLQKVWMRWHIKLGHLSFSHVMKLALGRFLDHHAHGLERNPLIGQPKCAACQFGKQVRRSDGTTITTKHPDHIGALKERQLKPGDTVFTDQLESRVRGRLLHTERTRKRTLLWKLRVVDAASGYVHIEHQVTLNANDSINAKSAFERMARDVGVDITKYHTDNRIYTSKACVADLVPKNQSIQHSGVGAKWQNGAVEGAIGMVVSKARTLMVHAALCGPEEEDDSLWPLSLTHTAHLFNHTPSQFNGIAPVEVFTSTLSDHEMLRNTHTWGSPVYVLEPRLTSAGGKTPKWQPRSRQGQYVGASPQHAKNIALVRNLKTGCLSPQFHVVFDDWFETVHSRPELPPDKWEDMCTFQ